MFTDQPNRDVIRFIHEILHGFNLMVIDRPNRDVIRFIHEILVIVYDFHVILMY